MITIKNLYYLLLYAWKVPDIPDEIASIDVEPETDLVNLLAKLLNHGIDGLLRRGIDRSYVLHVEDIPGIRGKLDLSATIKGNLLRRGRAVCEFDEFSADIIHNRILKTMLRRLLRCDKLDPELHDPLRTTYFRMAEIHEIPLSHRLFGSVHLHRHNRHYRHLLAICRLLLDCLIPDQATGDWHFQNFTRDEKKMNRIFERFLLNFYKLELKDGFKVRSPKQIRWRNTIGLSENAEVYLPTLNLDVLLKRHGRAIIIDAKYYKDVLQIHHSRATIHSGHLYQLFSYLKNPPDHLALSSLDGMLVYAQAGEKLDLRYELHGHRVRIYTIDLTQHWTGIRRELLGLVAE